jgi:hypothetical protein
VAIDSARSLRNCASNISWQRDSASKGVMSSQSIRKLCVMLGFSTLYLAIPTPLAAQIATDPLSSEAQTSEPEEKIDLLIPPPADQRLIERCTEEQEAASIAGEIVVCRRLSDRSPYRLDDDIPQSDASRQEQIDRFGLPAGLPADFAGPGIFRGKPTAGGGCLPGSCPPPAALIIDLEALPEAPAGSDADRIGRGLPPLGQDELYRPEQIEIARRQQTRVKEPLAAPPVGSATASETESEETETVLRPVPQEQLGLPEKPDFNR